MPKSLLAFTLFSFLTGNLLSNQLVIPEAFEVIKVNGKKNKTFLFSNNRKIKLEKGSYSIELKYLDFYDQGFDDFEKIFSERFFLNFEYDGHGDLTTDFKKPESISEAKKFAANPRLKILKESGVAIPSKIQNKAIPIKASAPSPKAIPEKIQSDSLSEPSAIVQLRYWWKKATLEQRQQFMKEILE